MNKQSRLNNLEVSRLQRNKSNSAGIGVIEIDFDLSTVSGATKDFIFWDSLLSHRIISIQAVWKNLSGVLDAEIDIIQSHTGEEGTFDLAQCNTVMNLANDSRTLVKADFGGQYAGIRYTKNQVAAGTLSLHIIAKNG